MKEVLIHYALKKQKVILNTMKPPFWKGQKEDFPAYLKNSKR